MKVVLIDADSLVYITCYKNKDSNNLDDYTKGIDEWITNIITNCGGTHYIGFLTIGKVFRHSIAKTKEYKSGRALEKPKFYYELIKHLKNKWKFIHLDNLEAEDLLAYNVEFCRQNNVDYVIAGIDHDLDQLPGIHYNYKKNEFKTISLEISEYNLALQLIQGCSTDKIVGIKGYGEAKAKMLLSSKLPFHGNKIYIKAVLEEYINVYGLSEGINNFTETFNLCYLLRTSKELNKNTNEDVYFSDHIDTPIEFLNDVERLDNNSLPPITEF